MCLLMGLIQLEFKPTTFAFLPVNQWEIPTGPVVSCNYTLKLKKKFSLYAHSFHAGTTLLLESFKECMFACFLEKGGSEGEPVWMFEV